MNDLSSAPEVLQNTAQNYAREAIKFDSQGSRGTAIQMYQKSIEALIKLTKCEKISGQNKSITK